MTAQPVPGVTLKTAKANNIHMRYAEIGSGPLVLFCHGWPESWYSWRHQLTALSAAGFRCVAPDMRGYGGTEAPEPIDQYTLHHLVGDMAELVKTLAWRDQGHHRRPRLGRAGRLARGPLATRSVSRRLRHERALRAARLCRHPERAREARHQRLLPAVLSEARRARGRVAAGYPRRPAPPLLHRGRRAPGKGQGLRPPDRRYLARQHRRSADACRPG